MDEPISQNIFSHNSLYKIIEVCASLPEIKAEVERNHDDNQWWPLYVEDWRLRMLIAGWSTRVSYNMIAAFQKVVRDAANIGFDGLCQLSEPDLRRVVKPLGLFKIRSQYLHSLQEFIDRYQDHQSLLSAPNDELINLFAKHVKWAGYKVAQCAVLYAKGYHCGIFPVDSGMKDMLGPCLGIELPKGAYAHEVMRKQIENILNQYPDEYRDLIRQLGYSHLQIPADKAPIWWAHLVLIYYKRAFCNQHAPESCPLRLNAGTRYLIGAMCHPGLPTPGRAL